MELWGDVRMLMLPATASHVLRRAAFCRMSSADVSGASTGDAVACTMQGALDVRLERKN